ncbi:MAG: DUF5335 domain-containing protein [Acidobacteriota bacterium]|nr:DUF5335 domain-containing protein [Acidobacteriota bacterium]MDH3528393.1 DUF5335 domain-containing protein [Acidobacteriota bacterium]
MTEEIPRTEWKAFFNDLSKRRFEWRTKVEVLGSIGDQILTQELPLNGITVEEGKVGTIVEIIVGFDEDNHQTHTIADPQRINYMAEEAGVAGVVEIVEGDGTRTMVHIIEPLPFKIGALRARQIAKSG